MSRLGPYAENTIACGHVLDVLGKLPDECVHMVCTSPPFWGLRDYGTEPQVWGGGKRCWHVWGKEQHITTGRNDGERPQLLRGSYTGGGEDRYYVGKQDASQGRFCSICGAWKGSLGLEPNPAMFVQHLVEVFREVKRTLRSDGTLWLNLGSSYAGSGSGGGGNQKGNESGQVWFDNRPTSKPMQNFKPKDLIPIPWMVAMALQQDGWYLRSSIVWAKGISFCPSYSGSTMPESCTDRPTSSYEYLFLLSKKAHYYYDQEAVREQAGEPHAPGNKPRKGILNPHGGLPTTPETSPDRVWGGNTRNLRSVWVINPQPFGMELCAKCKTVYTSKEYRRLSVHMEGERKHRICRECGSWQDWLSHFAVFPSALVEPCVKAGTSERGACPECGGPWERVVEKQFVPQQDVSLDKGIRGSGSQKPMDESSDWEGWPRGTTESRTLGWRPTCECYGEPLDDTPEAMEIWNSMDNVLPCIILDPFSGAGTTPKVSLEHRRNFFGIDLNPDYIQMSLRRIHLVQPRLAL